MEALVWRASNVVISYGVIRGEAGGASGTQVKEKKQGISKSSVEKARVGEKTAAGAPASGNNGRRFALAPLPLPSARNLVPAPLRFLWFPDNRKKRQNEEASFNDDGSSSGGVRRELQIKDVDDVLEADREREVIRLTGEEIDGGFLNGKLDVMESSDLGPGSGESSEKESDRGESKRSQDELSRFENGNAAQNWFKNILNVNFLKKNPKIDVKVPSAELLENAARSSSANGVLGAKISSQYDLGVQNMDQPVASAGSTLVDAEKGCKSAACKCAGCASESGENHDHDVDSPASPLTTLEVPHVNVTHDFESFSKFLSEVPLTELKIISRTNFLCNLAYVIPTIKPGELAKDHRMLFVTSSIDIKAEALAKEKAEALAREKAAAADKKEVERNEGGREAKRGSYLSPATAYTLAAAAVNFLRSQKKDPLALGKTEGACLNDITLGDSVLNEVTNPLDSDSMAMFFGPESNGSANGNETDLSSSDMPAFMRPVTAVVSAEKETKQEVADNLRSLHTCPCEWFACDEKGGPTRYFSIQGSESFASWQANLLFEPTQFEASDLGVMVHRGIYEAALGLYEQILPYVFEHQKRFGERAKFQFTGHSLGGSLGMLLSLMLNIRGVLKTSALLPVYTFGAPYVMCGGDYLLEKLGLPLTHVQYIVMHRDIVPRTFACNYPDHIAEILKRLNGTLREHSCLTRQRLLYAPMGQLVVLQPDQRQASPHPLLPSGSGLYLIRHQSHNEPPVSNSTDAVVSSRAVEVRAAQRAFLNQPHPLEIISDPAAYGSAGTISKNHDPRSYAKAINNVLRQEMRRWRRIQRERRRQLWWPLISADSAIVSSKGASLGVQNDQGAPKGVTSQGMFGRSGPGHVVSDIAAGRATFPVSMSGDLKGRFSRYKSLIASQHVQMGLVVVITARMLLEEGFAVLTWI